MAEAKVVLSGSDQTKAAFESLKSNFKSIGDQAGKISGLMGSLGVAIGAAFSAGSLMHLVEMLDSLDKMSEKTGITTKSLSALRYAGEIADVTQEKLGTGLKKLAKIMTEAAGGNDQAALTFKTLGIDRRSVDGRGPAIPRLGRWPGQGRHCDEALWQERRRHDPHAQHGQGRSAVYGV
jgi:hypothetical protein